MSGIMTGHEKTGLEIAVIGMSGRFPGANSIDEFWDDLKNGVESISFFSNQELMEDGIAPGLLESPGYVKAKGTLADVEVETCRIEEDSPALGKSLGEVGIHRR